MTATLVSGCGAAVAMASAASSSSKFELSTRAAGNSRGAAQRLIPVVGLVNRTKDRRLFRWQQQQQKQLSSRVDRGAHQWLAQAVKKVVSVNSRQFEAEVLKSSVPVLVDFWATWCGPCRLMALSLDWAAEKYDGKVKFVKIETDEGNQSLVDKYRVYGLPTLMLFVDGEIKANTHREGALNKEKLQEYLEANVPTLAAKA